MYQIIDSFANISIYYPFHPFTKVMLYIRLQILCYISKYVNYIIYQIHVQFTYFM